MRNDPYKSFEQKTAEIEELLRMDDTISTNLLEANGKDLDELLEPETGESSRNQAGESTATRSAFDWIV